MTATNRFIDLFAGCGGLSLGLIKSGWKGVFAVEKHPVAFETLQRNLIREKSKNFEWPIWLPKKAHTCEDILEKFSDELAQLRGKIDLIVGGPPCQGFSMAGKRNPVDPRNKMSEQYLALVGIIQPKLIVIENVAGFDIEFGGEEGDLLNGGGQKKSYASFISSRLETMGYSVSFGVLNCSDFGVPQNRKRFFIFCELKKSGKKIYRNLFNDFLRTRSRFLSERKLPITRAVSCYEAISDLETNNKILVPCEDSSKKGYLETDYSNSAPVGNYQKLMREAVGIGGANSRRLPNHKVATIEGFKKIQRICRPGISISTEEMKLVGTKKHAITVLNKDLPSPTVTTLPDDILHYSEPRILTARENARLQSFPDWYSFYGNYTTGGKRRKFDCPRYTQIGNAVPPLVSEAIGLYLKNITAEKTQKKRISTSKIDSKNVNESDA
jgi:DNA (cytosine-5)-methyltransferase 1